MKTEPDLCASTVRIVSAYAAHNSLRPSELPGLIRTVHHGLVGALVPPPARPSWSPSQTITATATARSPAEIKKSKSADWLISFENGRRYKCLKPHLAARGLSPDQYRKRWGLPNDYPMVAASYSAERARVARLYGLGTKTGAPTKTRLQVSPDRSARIAR